MRRAATSVALVLGLALAGASGARAEDDEARRLLAAPNEAKDARALRRAAEDVLETRPADPVALRALLVAVTRLDDADLMDDAVERARPALAAGGRPLAGAFGVALVRRARREAPPDPARLAEAERALAPEDGPEGDPAGALELAYARHLLGSPPAAAKAYERGLDGGALRADLALAGWKSLVGGFDSQFAPVLEDLALRRPTDGAVLRWRAEVAARTHGPATARMLLERSLPVVEATPRAAALLARWYREVERHDEALALERLAVARAGDDVATLAAIERAWRSARPLAGFEDCADLEADFERLVAACGDPWLAMTWWNDLGFRLREVVATYAWRGEGRTQGLAEGAPPEARRLLDRCVAVYERAASLVPKDAADRPFAQRWVYAAVWNDTGLMRHYWLDVRDLDRAETAYRKAFDLTDGAYMDTYFYNLQYLYGIEKPGNEETWWRLARKASERILAETPDGGFAPDEHKREAARRDMDALRRVLDERDAARK